MTALRDLYDIQGKKDAASVKGATPNPTNKKDAESLLTLVRFKLGDAPAWLDGASVVGIGGLNSLFPVALRALRGAGSDYAGATLSLAEVQRAFEGAIGKSDDELLVAAGTDENSDPPAYVVPKLALMLAVFERTKVAEVEYQPSVGGCEGLLCAAAGEFGAFVALQARGRPRVSVSCEVWAALRLLFIWTTYTHNRRSSRQYNMGAGVRLTCCSIV